MRRIPLIGALAAAAVLVPAAVSHAATVSYENGAIVYRGEGSEGLDLLASASDDGTQLYLHDSGADRQLITSGPCTNDASWGVICDLDANRPLKVYGSAGKDRLHVYFHGIPTSMPIEIHGGAGDDDIQDSSGDDASRRFYGDAGNDTVQGFGGNDVVDGGDGNDEVDGGAGDDKVYGGAGNDTMWGDHYEEPGADVIDGGPGTDSTQDWSIPSDLDNQPAVDVTLDGIANDGRPGEGDNVTNVEKFQMYVVGRLVGGSGPENIDIYNPGNQGPSTLIGNGGDDTLIGNDYDDSVDGGPGNDHVEGGMGNDVVTGGPGRDVIYGDATAASCTWYSCKIPFGNDVIYARDGEPDSIDCGVGTDKAVVDAIDTVANCETVEAAGPSGPGHPGQPGGPGTPGGAGALAISVAKVRLAALAAKGLVVGVPCPTACRVAATLTYKGKAAGSGRATAIRAGKAKVRVKLSKAGRKALQRVRSARLTLKVSMSPASGARKTAKRTFTVKR